MNGFLMESGPCQGPSKCWQVAKVMLVVVAEGAISCSFLSSSLHIPFFIQYQLSHPLWKLPFLPNMTASITKP